MRSEVAFYSGNQRIGATCEALSSEEVMLKLLVKRFFVADRDGGAWLIFDRADGRAVGLLIGPFKPHPKAARQMRKLPVAIGQVDIKLAPIIKEFGLEALKWDGTAVVAAGQ